MNLTCSSATPTWTMPPPAKTRRAGWRSCTRSSNGAWRSCSASRAHLAGPEAARATTFRGDARRARPARGRPRVGRVAPLRPSEWTTRELNEFCKAAEQQGGVQITNKSRIFKVLKTPVPLDQQSPALRSLLGYEFFTVDPENGKFREFDEEFGPETSRSS